jgi:preprotein translocase SecE subunit
VARNRKRAKERRSRRPQPVATSRHDRTDSPDPIEHAAPGVELAEAQMALGRPELASESEENVEPLEPESPAPGVLPGPPQIEDGDVDLDAGPALPAPRAPTGNRLLTFLQGSWRELQRVQWPDRRQVVQATGVVIGFVIVAGAFLGLADLVAGKLANLIIK